MKHLINSLILVCLLTMLATNASAAITAGTTISEVNYVLPEANLFYDFAGIGEKGYLTVRGNTDVYGQYTETPQYIFTNGFSQNFSEYKKLNIDLYNYKSAIGEYASLLEDINNDGNMDFGILPQTINGNYAYFANTDGTKWIGKGAFRMYPNWDMNGDGRKDGMEINVISSGGYPATYTNVYTIHYQQPNGEFVKQPIEVMSKADYVTQFDPNAWEQISYGTGGGLVGTVGNLTGIFSGFSGAKAPRKESVSPIQKANSTMYRYGQPAVSIDLNKDGLPDMIDQKNGIIYYNMGQNKFIESNTGGFTVARDLNGDNIPDFIVHSATKLHTVVYKGNDEFTSTLLLENFAVDDEVYCYDFDRDGDIDILVTLSYASNGTASYMLFFENDGNGNFTAQPEFASTNQYIFSNCHDVDGDGYMDILAFECSVEKGNWSGPINGGSGYYLTSDSVKVICLKGQSNFGFAPPEVLLSFPSPDYYRILDDSFTPFAKINAEDLYNNGMTAIWVSNAARGIENGKTTICNVLGTQNTASAQPAKPVLNYNEANGMLTVSWQAGTDAQSQSADLTYELRIGSASGKDDVLAVKANADGTRRNFLDGNMGSALTHTISLATRPVGTYYVAVQAIDPQHKGSTWSEEVPFEHSYLPVNFSVNKTICTFGDTLQIHYTEMPATYTYTWETDTNALLISDVAGLRQIRYPVAGQKTIALTIAAPNGNTSRHSVDINVLPNGAFGNDSLQNSYNGIQCTIADYNRDGLPDYAASDGVYTNNGGGTFSKAVGMWNTGLTFDSEYYNWLDYNRDGLVDLIYKGKNISSGYLKNNGNGTFTKKTDSNVEGYFWAQGPYYAQNPLAGQQRIDWDNDGWIDGWCYQNSTGYFLKNNGDNTFSQVIPSGNADVNGLLTAIGNRKAADFNNDGLWDIYDWKYENSLYTGVMLYLNAGNFEFNELFVPFATGMLSPDFSYKYLMDMNNDGYYDVVAQRESDYGKVFYILWNNANKSFSEPEFIQPDVTFNFSSYGNIYWYDYDNNGYVDMLKVVEDSQKKNRFYIIYFDANGVCNQGFVSDAYSYNSNIRDLNGDGLPDLYQNHRNENTYALIGALKSANANAKPSAPTGISTVQNETGLLIKWTPAEDDATPYARMRYNLSVKRKYATGDNSYIISPQNAGNAAMAALPHYDDDARANNSNCYHYLQATQFCIPNSVLTTGEELEISLQAVDLWGAMSVFSETVNVKIDAAASISAPATACSTETVNITYTGAQSAETPVWDFAGGTILSGSGFGPYEVVWNTAGTKQVTLTLGTETAYVNVTVQNALDAAFEIPSYVIYNTATEITLPKVTSEATFKWEVQIGNDPEWYENNGVTVTAVPGNKKGTVTFTKYPEAATRQLRLTVTQNGCEQVFTSALIHIISEDATPEITLVTPNANNKNVISWNASNMPTEATGVIIWKESSYYNDYYELARVGKSAGSYTDASSNATVKSERYKLQLLYGSAEGPVGTPHQTVHVTINRGVTDTQWNLIWNNYQGVQVATYRILRGADANSLTEIANVSASNTSYTDNTPDASAPYYVIEYELYSAQYQSKRQKAPAATVSGRSNVVNASSAQSMVFVSRLNIMSANGSTSTTANVPSLYLYTEMFPTNATYQNVKWEITSGSDLATIDQSGKLTAKTPNAGGTVTVKATAVDGSGISNTRTFTIAAIGRSSILCSSIIVNSVDGTNLMGESKTTLQLSATIAPVNASNQSVTWSVVTGQNLASISNVGLVTLTNTQVIGNITVRATANDGSGVFGEFNIQVAYTALVEVNGTQWHVYPNPASEYLLVDGLAERTDITILSLVGTVVYHAVASSNISIPMANLLQGNYLLIIQSEKQRMIEKIIKR